MGAPRYRSTVYDSARWDGFELRPGDIVVTTPPKCGTTWTQMICALLVFQDPDLPEPLASLSPWVDMITRGRGEVFAALAAQEHRRFIKTHTPLDGLPVSADVTYVCVGRDPRDVALSMDHHIANMDREGFLEQRAAAAAADGVELPPLGQPPERPADELGRFWRWVDDDTPVTDAGSTLRYTLHHLRSYWDARGDLDVVLVHYDDLSNDLEGEMRRLADRLGIVVAEGDWPRLVQAATFDAMRSRPELTVPGADHRHWKDPSAFFHSGTSGQWRALLDDDGLRRYAEAVAPLAPADLSAWVHRPPLA